MHVTFGLTKALDEDETSRSWLSCAPGVGGKIIKYLAAEIEVTVVFMNTKQEHEALNTLEFVFYDGTNTTCCWQQWDIVENSIKGVSGQRVKIF